MLIKLKAELLDSLRLENYIDHQHFASIETIPQRAGLVPRETLSALRVAMLRKRRLLSLSINAESLTAEI